MILDLIVRNSGIYDRVVYKKTIVGIKKHLPTKTLASSSRIDSGALVYVPMLHRVYRLQLAVVVLIRIAYSSTACAYFYICVHIMYVQICTNSRHEHIYKHIRTQAHTRAYTLMPTHAHTYTHLYTTTHIHLRSAYRKHQFLYGTPYEFQDRLAFCSYIQREFISLRPNYTFLFYVQLQPLTLYVLVLYNYGHQISNTENIYCNR